MTRSTTVAIPQIAVSDLNTDRNRRRIRERLAALPARVDVAVFPEYALTGFVCDESVREAALDREDAVAWTRERAHEHGLDIVVGYLESGTNPESDSDPGREPDLGKEPDPGREPDLYNALAYVPQSGTETVYRKRHLWGQESAYVSPGESLAIAETPLGPAGLLTCYDLNFVGESAELTEHGVNALFVGGAWPAAHSENWRLLLRARALDGVRWVVGAGRTGEGETSSTTGDAASATYAGRSAVVRPDGSFAAALNRDERDLIADIEPDVLEEHRTFIGSIAPETRK